MANFLTIKYLLFSISYNILPPPRRKARLSSASRLINPMLTKLMTGNNSGARRLTMFVLTPAAANELFTVRRVAGFPGAMASKGFGG